MRIALITSLLWAIGPAGAWAGNYKGEIDWLERVELSTTVSGIVAKIEVQAGDQVQKGQVLVRLDEREFKARLRSTQAQSHKLKLTRDEAQREFQRTQELYERTVISQHDLQLAEIAFASAEADYVSATSRRVEAELELERATISAPFDGIILAVSVNIGQAVINTQTASPMVTVAGNGLMTAKFLATGSDLEALRTGQAVLSLTIGTTPYQSTIESMGLEPTIQSDGSLMYPVTISFKPTGLIPPIGSKAEISIP